MARKVSLLRRTSAALLRENLPARRRDSHKGDYGKVLLLCGSVGLTGAARLAAKAALRCGSGLVYLGVPEAVYPIIAANAGSEIVFPLPCDKDGRLCLASRAEIEKRLNTMDAVLFGPGLGRSEELTELTAWLITSCKVPLLLDADGINALEGHIDRLRGATCSVVLTPHDGEFTRLGGDTKNPDRLAETKRLATESGTILLRKGPNTLITDGKTVYSNHTGNPGMATGGSGDVLSGIIVSLLGQGIAPLKAAAIGAWLHGAAGDLAADELGQAGMLPEDIVQNLPRLLP